MLQRYDIIREGQKDLYHLRTDIFPSISGVYLGVSAILDKQVKEYQSRGQFHRRTGHCSPLTGGQRDI